MGKPTNRKKVTMINYLIKLGLDENKARHGIVWRLGISRSKNWD